MGKRRKNKRHRAKVYATAKATPVHHARSVLKERPKVEPAPDLDEDRRWHVVRTNIKCEERAELGLKALGFATYRPVYVEQAARRGRVVDLIRHLFPRYVFVGFNPKGESWYPILKTDGVEALLRSRSSFAPLAIPTGFIDGLAAKAEATMEPPPPFLVGETVRIDDGPFVDFAAEIQVIRADATVQVLANIFGRLTPVDLPLNAIARL